MIALALLLSAAPVPGSRADLNAALDALYPKEVDLRFGLTAAPGEKEPPLAEVVVYRASKPVPHWHYVTYGLTELEGKVSGDPTLSGFGMELTLRLVDASKQPPPWAIQLLRFLANEMWKTGFAFDPRHSLNVPKGMLDEVAPGVEGLAFFEDPQLPTLKAPTGKIAFVTVVPLMAGELKLIGSWDALKVADAIRKQQGGDLLWRPGRVSLLAGPGAEAVRAQAEKDGSSEAIQFADVGCDGKGVVVGSETAMVLDKFLRYRLAYGRPAQIMWEKRTHDLAPGPWKLKVGKTGCALSVPRDEARALADALAAAKDGTVVTRAGGMKFLVDRSK